MTSTNRQPATAIMATAATTTPAAAPVSVSASAPPVAAALPVPLPVPVTATAVVTPAIPAPPSEILALETLSEMQTHATPMRVESGRGRGGSGSSGGSGSGRGGSGRSLSPPARAVSSSLLHLYPTATPPRTTPRSRNAAAALLDAAELKESTAKSAKKLLLFQAGRLTSQATSRSHSKRHAASSRSTSVDGGNIDRSAIKSAAAAAVMAAQAEAAKNGVSPPQRATLNVSGESSNPMPPPESITSASVIAPPHWPGTGMPSFPAMPVALPSFMTMAGQDGHTVASGVGTAAAASHVPPIQANAASMPYSGAMMGVSSWPFHTNLPFSSPLPSPSPPPPKQAVKRNLINKIITKTLKSLGSRHGSSVQYHFMLGLQLLRQGQWKQAATALRIADAKYAPVVEAGSTAELIRQTSIAQSTSDKAAPTREPSTAVPSRLPSTSPSPSPSSSPAPSTSRPNRSHSQPHTSRPTHTHPASHSNSPPSSQGDEIELTQPIFDSSQPMDESEADEEVEEEGEDEQKEKTEEITGMGAAEKQAAAPLSAYVARKAADIKVCLAIALWKDVFYTNMSSQRRSAAGASTTADRTHSSTPTLDHGDAAKSDTLQEAQRLFEVALELEGGARLSTWNHFALFLFATGSIQQARSVLIDVINTQQAAMEERRALWTEQRQSAGSVLDTGAENEWREMEEAATGAGSGLDDLQSTLSLLQITSGTESDEAIINMQEILERNAARGTHHLPTMNNYALMCSKQQKSV